MSESVPAVADRTGPEIVVRRFADRAALDFALAARLARACADPAARASAAVMLSGGDTPRAAYALTAARAVVPRSDLVIVYSDERYVPPDSEASNYRSTKTLLESLRLPDERVLRVATELTLHAAADDYEARLARLFAAGVGIGFGLLGIGADGHTASLFSNADLARADGRLAISVRRPDGRDAVSVTPSLLARVAEPVFVVAGADKRAAVSALVRGDRELIAWRAIEQCARVEVWTEPEAYPQDRVQL